MIHAKLLDISATDTKLKKDGLNPHFKSKYLTLDSINDTYVPLLTMNKILCYHYTKDSILTTVLHDTEDNTSITSEFAILNSDPQKRGGEITYGKRYNLGMLLNIITEEDDDGNKASGENFTSSANGKQYGKSESDELIEEMEFAPTIEQAKEIFTRLYTMGKSDKQKAFFKSKWDKVKAKHESDLSEQPF